MLNRSRKEKEKSYKRKTVKFLLSTFLIRFLSRQPKINNQTEQGTR